MANIKLDLKNTKLFEKNLMKYADKVSEIHKKLHDKIKDENEFCGWLNLPSDYDKKEFDAIKKSAKKNTSRFRCVISNRNWWLLSRGKSCY